MNKLIGTATFILSAALFGSHAEAKDIEVAAGDHFTCAWIKNEVAKCWGFNNVGQLGQGDTAIRGNMPGQMGDKLPVIKLGTGRTATKISVGAMHACALLDNNEVKCWGDNSHGQLGLGDTNARGDIAGEMDDALPAVDLGKDPVTLVPYTAQRITAGALHTCALLNNNEVKCWGYNHEGQLGLADMIDRGVASGQMGDDLKAVALGRDSAGVKYGATEVGAFGYHTCAKLDNGDLKCWGKNFHGQLGQGDTNNRGDVAGELGNNLVRVKLGPGRTALNVAGGGEHLCALLDDATVKCWGYNTDGQLGLGNTDDRGDGPGEMAGNLLAVELGSGLTALDIAAGGNHSCALLSDNSVKCWGYNHEGQLGQSDVDSRGGALNQMGSFLLPVDLGTGRTANRIAAGAEHTCAVLDNQQLKCWGYNVFGQLGLGDFTNRGDQAGEMGDALPAIQLGTL